MKECKKLDLDERQKIYNLFKMCCEDLEINIFSEEPYIQFPDGTIIYLEGMAD